MQSLNIVILTFCVCWHQLFNVIVGCRQGGGWQTLYVQSVSLHQHIKTGLDVTLDPRPGVCWVGKGSPLLVEAVVWRRSEVRGQWVLRCFDGNVAVRAVFVPGCLYTVEMSILKVPMWVVRKARARLWNTWEEATLQVFMTATPTSPTILTAIEVPYLYLYDFIKEDLWKLLKLKLEVLKDERRQTSVAYLWNITLLHLPGTL